MSSSSSAPQIHTEHHGVLTEQDVTDLQQIVHTFVAGWNAHDAAQMISAKSDDDADFVSVMGHYMADRQSSHDVHDRIHKPGAVFGSTVMRVVSLGVRGLASNAACIRFRWALDNKPVWPDEHFGMVIFVCVKNEAGEWRVKAFQNTDVSPNPIPEPMRALMQYF